MNLAIDLEQRYTWKEYKDWPEDERWELIHGEAYSAAAPSVRHQDISINLASEFHHFLKDKPCRPFTAPTDVKLSDEDVVQPDLLVVCDDNQIEESHIEGAPKLVIEIISSFSAIRDRHDKMMLYADYGVVEYWLVTPFPALVEVFVLDGGTYRLTRSFTKEETLNSPSFPGLEIALEDVFTFPLSEEEKKLFAVRESPARYR